MNLKKIRQGNEQAFMDMVEECTPVLKSYIINKLYGFEDLDDLVQEVFIAAYKGRHTIRSTENIEAWLKGIARNKLKLLYRTKSRRQRMNLNFQEFVIASIDENSDDHCGNEEKKILQFCIKKLPEQLKKLVTLRHLSGIRVKDLAEKEGCSESQLSVNLFRARQKLRECVEKNR